MSSLSKITPSSTPEEVAAYRRCYMRAVSWSYVDQVYVGSLPEISGPCCHGDTLEETYRQLDEVVELFIDIYIHPEEVDIVLAEPGGMERYLSEFPAALQRWSWNGVVGIAPWVDVLAPLSPDSSPEEIEAAAAMYVRVSWWSPEESCYIGTLPEIDHLRFYRAPTQAACLEQLSTAATSAVRSHALGASSIPAPRACPVSDFARS